MTINHFEDLEIWQDARSLCKSINELTRIAPFCNDFRFRDQIKSSSGSIMDNIAEGFGRGGNKEFTQFLSIAQGSCSETKSQIYRAFDYEYINEATQNDLLDKTGKLSGKISNFMTYLKNSDLKGRKYK
ncbi:MAG: four helix bundle protein [Bacteroidetes bacterium GWF2_38_335]|nr:MAG: four helix bundle protein [Bacteroidetes bacterium GWF2_38_335]OFY77103.1 MAG: four helix bundle protein [Bacteroidetes bacterium RIFOXYA12_FULL_38_20]HBS84993.1 four helix bundle protein [Bacteroidales bacterium]